MNDSAASQHTRIPIWRIAGWSAIGTLLSLPAILRFPWTPADFVVMGILLGSVGLAIELLVRLTGSVAARLGAFVAVLTGFLTIWVNLAVGMIGDGNAYNLLFVLPLVVALVGGVLVRLESHRMTRLCLLAGALQVALGFGGYAVDPRGAIFSACFGPFWLLAAALFHVSAMRVGRQGHRRG